MSDRMNDQLIGGKSVIKTGMIKRLEAKYIDEGKLV
jgi:hypothetical protein